MSIVENIVGRLHVSASARDVIRAIRSKLKKPHRRDPSKREARKEMYRKGLAAHERNKTLYLGIMSGNIR
jgi:hypothetical protein